MQVHYFAWVRERIGMASENIALPAGVATAGELMAHLAQRSPGHADAFADPEKIRIAVNEDHVAPEHPVRDGDDIAFFPPVTGG